MMTRRSKITNGLLILLAAVLVLAGWEPQEAYFNDRNLNPPPWKELVLRAHLLPRFRPEEMFAIESNPNPRAMYARHGIRALPVGGRPWKMLPV